MSIEVVEDEARDLTAYESIPIAFRVSEIIEAVPEPTGRSVDLRARAIATPYTKDYDAYDEGSPVGWTSRFGAAKWGILAAYVNGERVGGAVVVAHDSTIDLLEGRRDLAVVWDLRVAPAFRRTGVGSALMAAALHWARDRRTRVLKVETQNINVAACRFYQRHGFILGAVHVGAYAAFPDEVQLFWYKRVEP